MRHSFVNYAWGESSRNEDLPAGRKSQTGRRITSLGGNLTCRIKVEDGEFVDE